MDFFSCGRFLRKINVAYLTLVPKKEVPMSVNNFRPIACFNVVYKCICKILANRIKDCLGDVVDQTQSSFVPGRRISDNFWPK